MKDVEKSPTGSKAAETPAPAADVRVCIVTGLSGAGKSTALKVFEDMGHFVVDGLPVSLAMEMVSMMSRPSMSHFKGIALGMDLRQSNFVDEINDCLSQLAGKNIRPMLLFLEANSQELIRRYAATRRPHPLEREGMERGASRTHTPMWYAAIWHAGYPSSTMFSLFVWRSPTTVVAGHGRQHH